MAAKNKVIYFTAKDVPTTAEKADIQKLNEAAVATYEIGVRSSVRPMSSGGPIEAADFVAGTIPDAYSEVPTIDPDTIGTGATVTNGGVVAVRNSAGADSHNATAVVTGTTLTGVNLAATVALVDQGDSVTMQNSAGTAIAGTHAATVAAGVLSNVKLAATVAPVVNAASLPLQNSAGASKGNGTVAVAAGVVTSVRTPATSAIVANGDTVPATGTGTTATLVIANGVVTGVTLA